MHVKNNVFILRYINGLLVIVCNEDYCLSSQIQREDTLSHRNGTDGQIFKQIVLVCRRTYNKFTQHRQTNCYITNTNSDCLPTPRGALWVIHTARGSRQKDETVAAPSGVYSILHHICIGEQ